MPDKDFFEKVFWIVRQIPYGKVSTYGHIGEAIGLKSSARMVGWALNSVAGDLSIPCHRVVNRNGELTGKRYFATPDMMREMLEAEGIEFIGEHVNMEKHLWVPSIKE
ncbi:MGMT family protein [Bacteroidetes/Chlorobi group bacterium ChocPot_Mid]|jgi:O-6-methylguanine DNA methyltransferase|nr:MAG: MGMT family protein [Bacteroidetes/Chlorobi group bacterium ChocPot_Mid]